MERITDLHLKRLCDRLNSVTGSPPTAYTHIEDGKYVANIGNFHLDHANGGVSLVRMYNAAGGVSSPIESGYTTKRDLYNLMHAFLRGIELTKE